MRYFLQLYRSFEYIALTLAWIYPKGHKHRVSHETIYNSIYATAGGRAATSCLRPARNKRVPRSKGQDQCGQIPDMLSIHLCPPEIEDRQFPIHWEGDLLKGEGNANGAGMLIKLSHSKPASAANVLLRAFSDKLLGVASPLCLNLSLTCDEGREMALHKKLTEKTGVAVYFCNPRSPRQSDSNENINGLVRQYLPKGTDLSVYSQEQLDAIADEVNYCSRKSLGYDSRWRFTANFF